MSALVDRWLVALGLLTALLAASVAVAFWIQQETLDVLNSGFNGDADSPELIVYSRISAGYMLVSQVTPILIIAAGLGVVSLLVVLSHRWTALEERRVRDVAEA